MKILKEHTDETEYIQMYVNRKPTKCNIAGDIVPEKSAIDNELIIKFDRVTHTAGNYPGGATYSRGSIMIILSEIFADTGAAPRGVLIFLMALLRETEQLINRCASAPETLT
ncbi:hypothetical protein EVAR_61515_1 [Eumeta japonica]|uniref:Uncharacterized protein n=1 Tax=Eumeta variegata TaxID=151549 RepID=A0A4C2A786_EUMVA|nr:hypothetical protein EVAR_61515_1 [Eumeta japonica]